MRALDTVPTSMFKFIIILALGVAIGYGYGWKDAQKNTGLKDAMTVAAGPVNGSAPGTHGRGSSEGDPVASAVSEVPEDCQARGPSSRA